MHVSPTCTEKPALSVLCSVLWQMLRKVRFKGEKVSFEGCGTDDRDAERVSIASGICAERLRPGSGGQGREHRSVPQG